MISNLIGTNIMFFSRKTLLNYIMKNQIKNHIHTFIESKYEI
jgi:hypothetical protein